MLETKGARRVDKGVGDGETCQVSLKLLAHPHVPFMCVRLSTCTVRAGYVCMYVSMIDGCPGAPGARMNYESLLFSSQMQDLAHIGVKLIYLLPLISYARKMARS